jgi:type VI secretion system protein ImpB
MGESTQHRLDTVRPPRVQLTYDVETGGAIVMKELPFVLGILADLSGKPANPLPPVRDRKFVEIDGDSFNDIMASTKPRLAFSVDNKLTNDGTQMGVELILSSMDDFLPVNVVKQMPELAKLYDARTRLNDMLAKLEGNEALDSMLIDIMTNKSTRDGLVASLKAATTPATK